LPEGRFGLKLSRELRVKDLLEPSAAASPRPAQPASAPAYSPPEIVWEQEFVALAQTSVPPPDCINNPSDDRCTD
jgi:hypothetical protein